MSTYRTPNSPFYQYDFQIHGHRFHGSTKKTTKRAADQVEAEEKRKARAALDAGDQPVDVTIDAAAGEYWLNIARHQPTCDTTFAQIENLIRILGKTRLLSQIRDAEVADFVARRRGEPHRKYKRRKGFVPPVIGPATVNRETELLRRILTRAARVMRAKLPPEHDRPDWKLHRLAEPDAPDRPLTVDQERRFMAQLVAHVVPIVDVALLTGLRLSEIINLDCSTIDLSARRGRVLRKSRKHGGEWFTFEITEPVLAVLADHVDGRTDGPVWRYGPHCDCALCSKKSNHGRRIKSVRTAFEGARRRAGIPEFRFHDLRHTFGTRVLALTGNLKAAQGLLGHKDISTTTRYAHHAPNALADVQRLIAEMRPEKQKIAKKSRNNPEDDGDQLKKDNKIRRKA